MFKVERKALAEALGRLAPLVKRTNVIPILSHVLISAKQDAVLITATDMKSWACATMPAEGDGGQFTAQMDKLMAIAAGGFGEHVEFTPGEGVLKATCGRGRFTLSGYDIGDFPTPEKRGDAGACIEMSASALHSAVKSAAMHAAENDVRNYLNGAYLQIDEGIATWVATNGHRCLVKSTPCAGDASGVTGIVPHAALTVLGRALPKDDQTVVIKMNERQVDFEVEGFSLTASLVDGTYPDYRRILAKEVSTPVVVNREQLREAVDLIGGFSDAKYRAVAAEVSRGKLTLKANSTENADAGRVDLDADYGGEPLTVGFALGYLLDAVSVLPGEDIRIHVAAADRPMLLTGTEPDVSVTLSQYNL